jgi:phosphoribosyl 1,2-cyclic phosphate phosphodiesterase
MALSFTILGCGSSGGVPRIDGNWGKCDPAHPRNRRRRCAGLVQQTARAGATRLLIDTPPDIRESLLAIGPGGIDGVFFTHDHADHTHGIDELRVFALNAHARIPVYFDAVTGARITAKFDYCFRNSVTGSYPAILKPHEIEPLQPVTLGGKGGLVRLTPFAQEHGEIISLGYRVGALAYSPDVSGIPEASLSALKDLDVWIIDALRPAPHPSHFSVGQALEWIEKLAPKRAILTHLHIDLDYEALKRKLPAHVEPAFDGMVIELDA